MKKKKKKGWILPVLLLLAVFWWFETFTLTVSTATVQSEKVEDPVTIVQLTDLHGSAFGSENKNLIIKIKQQNPDFIVATGDMYTNGDNHGKETAYKLLANLAQAYSVYFVNGEHDKDEDFFARLRGAGVHVMDYKKESVTVGKTKINLYGITNVYYASEFHLSKSFDSLDPDSYNILLAHIENFPEFSDFGFDLSLCGDTHGGQVRLPYVGALINRGLWFPEITGGGAQYTKGLYQEGKASLFVSSGLGNCPVPIRLFNRPEIAVIHIQRGQSSTD